MRKKIIAGILIVIGLFLGIKFLFFNKIGEIMFVYDNEMCQSFVYLNDKLIGRIDGEASFMKNMDNTSCYLYTQHISGCCYDNGGKDAVYYLKGNDFVLVGENMALISVATHSKEALLIDENGCLYRFDGKNLEQLTDTVIKNAAISGNGKYYAYFANGNSYFGEKPENEIIVNDVMICYISNNAECIYGIENKENTGYYDIDLDWFGADYLLYMDKPDMYMVDKNGDMKLIAEGVTNVNCLNANGKSIMYTTEEGTFVSKNGGKSEQISEKQVTSTHFNVKNKNWVDDFGPFKSFDGVICWLEGKNDLDTIGFIEEDLSIKEIISEESMYIVDVNHKNDKVLYKVFDSPGDYNYYILDVKNETCSLVVGSEATISCMDVESEYFYYFDGDVYRNSAGVVDFQYSMYFNDTEGNAGMVKTAFSDVIDIYSYKSGCFVICKNGVYYVEGKNAEILDGFDSINGFFGNDDSQSLYAWDDEHVYKVVNFKLKKLEGEYKSIEWGTVND